MTTALVSLRGFIKRYIRGKQRVEVLHGIDLEIRAGEFLALMGPSGSGKTTLLNLIGGIDRADEGDLLVAGERINALSARTTWGSCFSSTISCRCRLPDKTLSCHCF